MALSQVKSQFKGSIGADLSFSIAAAFTNQNQPFLIVFESKEIAAFHLNDLELLLPKEAVLFYPGSYRRSYEIEQTDNTNVLLRSEVLNRINSQRKSSVIRKIINLEHGTNFKYPINHYWNWLDDLEL